MQVNNINMNSYNGERSETKLPKQKLQMEDIKIKGTAIFFPPIFYMNLIKHLFLVFIIMISSFLVHNKKQ